MKMPQLDSPAKGPRWHSLRVRMILAFALIVIPVLVTVVWGVVTMASNFVQTATDDRLACSAAAAANAIERWDNYFALALRNVRGQPDIVNMIPSDQTPVLQQMLDTYSSLQVVRITGTNGNVISRAARATTRPGNDHGYFGDRDWFKAAIRGQPIAREALVSRDTGKPSITFATPVLDAGGHVIGVLAAVTNIASIPDVLHLPTSDPLQRIYLVDDQGHALMHPDLQAAGSLSDLSSYPPVTQVLHRTGGSFDFTDGQGQQWQSYTRRLTNGWSIVSQIPRDSVAAPIRALVGRAVWMGTVGLLAAAVLVGVVTRRLILPVRALRDAVDQLAAGDWSRRAVRIHDDEIGQLADAFNQMADRLETAYRLVEDQVGQRTEELRLSNDALRRASAAKDIFLANMSHEIRTPLNGILGAVELLESSTLDGEQHRFLLIAKTSTDSLLTIVNDILDYSKIEAGKLELENVEFDPSSIVEDVVELLGQKALSKNVEIACDIGSDVPPIVRGDGIRLRQILTNLLANAVKFTQAGQIIVCATLHELKSEFAILRFSVTDTGLGIPRDKIDRLFRVFSQVDPSTTRQFGGTGLGLAICKQLAELMEGEIGVDSEIGKGSQFWFTAKFKVASRPARPPYKPLAGRRGIILHSNNTIAQTLGCQLLDAGMDVQIAKSLDDVAKALDDATRSNVTIDTALLDHGMMLPDLCTAMAKLRGPATTEIRWLIMTTAWSDLTEETLGCAGAYGKLIKPIRREHLMSAVMDVKAKSEVPAAPTRAARAIAIPAANQKRIRILIVEDNHVNQIIAKEVLAQAGLASDIVDNGNAAIQSTAMTNYDLILMDCQMPGMDGFEATAVIRQREKGQADAGQSARRIPIIALTANASGTDRKRCLEAGMDGYCSKPFKAQELLDAIAPFLQIAPRPSAPVAMKEVMKPMIEPTVDDSPIDVPGLLAQCSNNIALAQRVLQTFQEQAPEAAQSLAQSMQKKDASQLSKLSHKLKGSASVLSAQPLRELTQRMEDLSLGAELSALEPLMNQLQQEIERCLSFIPKAQETLAAKGK